MEFMFKGKIKSACSGIYEHDWIFGDKVTELSTRRAFICDLSHFDDTTLLKNVLVEVDPKTVELTKRGDTHVH